jgi:hypothetical protein
LEAKMLKADYLPLLKTKAKVLLNLFIYVPVIHLANVFFSQICTCIWRVCYWVLYPKIECKTKKKTEVQVLSGLGNTSDGMNNELDQMIIWLTDPPKNEAAEQE